MFYLYLTAIINRAIKNYIQYYCILYIFHIPLNNSQYDALEKIAKFIKCFGLK